jgi:formate/nitrite transporter FocA (FNT family)
LLTWGWGAHGLLTNIAITTVGNLVGGTVFVALPFHLVAKLHQQDR